ncbi:transglutaminase family protein [Spirulina major]|uniref:transglutaminase family protein n=1 Tax=Spirulina major TaxID=270636 RepID=UPI00093270B9|nr:transglutaminase family protein [Spirulina major]
MRYHIRHKTTYRYSDRIILKPHLIRLYPQGDARQRLEQWELQVTPEPVGRSQFTDLDGNTLTKVWFHDPTPTLTITATMTVETLQSNPFNYLLDAWATALPWDYPHSLAAQLTPYLRPVQASFDPGAIALAQDLHSDSQGNTLDFLNRLNQMLYTDWDYIYRASGAPWLPGVTLRRRQGSCRDWAVLFMEVCRSLGIPARFVSGYQEGDRDQSDRDLHAWIEVYLPGAGWHGYDPTQGLLVSDRHIPLCASADPQFTAPITGQITPSRLPPPQPVTTTMESAIALEWLTNSESE